MTIASIDFETANYSDASICAAGLAVFEDGQLSESLYWLVRPPKGHGWFREDFTECHGLTWFDVQNAPDFSGIAPEFLRRLTHADLVIAHNAAFDVRKLRGTLAHFGVECPDFEFLCTLRASRRTWPDLPDHCLGTVAAHIGHAFHHHNAQEDAEAAGRILFAMLKHESAATPMDLGDQFGAFGHMRVGLVQSRSRAGLIKREMLNAIVHCRVRETFQSVKRRLESCGVRLDSLLTGVHLTGGLFDAACICELAEEVFGIPAERSGERHLDRRQRLQDPRLSCALGLVKLASGIEA